MLFLYFPRDNLIQHNKTPSKNSCVLKLRGLQNSKFSIHATSKNLLLGARAILARKKSCCNICENLSAFIYLWAEIVSWAKFERN